MKCPKMHCDEMARKLMFNYFSLIENDNMFTLDEVIQGLVSMLPAETANEEMDDRASHTMWNEPESYIIQGAINYLVTLKRRGRVDI